MMRTDEDGFEIPDDMELITEEETLNSLFYAEQTEYDRLKLESPKTAEQYKNNCIKERIQRYLDKKSGRDKALQLDFEQWNEHRRILYEKGLKEAELYKTKIIKHNLEKWMKTR